MIEYSRSFDIKKFLCIKGETYAVKIVIVIKNQYKNRNVSVNGNGSPHSFGFGETISSFSAFIFFTSQSSNMDAILIACSAKIGFEKIFSSDKLMLNFLLISAFNCVARRESPPNSK